ncbi:hypothetical protein TcWFU_008200 [Taenia crassiceps]|uniref:Uncharacterized protein n=1 Tax=Taenia crassiceps TaxID=6207 RepID=A0ABR4Q9H1_9CEST
MPPSGSTEKQRRRLKKIAKAFDNQKMHQDIFSSSNTACLWPLRELLSGSNKESLGQLEENVSPTGYQF